nr:ORF-1a [Pineapple mealybug wilt-associated virus 3]
MYKRGKKTISQLENRTNILSFPYIRTNKATREKYERELVVKTKVPTAKERKLKFFYDPPVINFTPVVPQKPQSCPTSPIRQSRGPSPNSFPYKKNPTDGTSSPRSQTSQRSENSGTYVWVAKSQVPVPTREAVSPSLRSESSSGRSERESSGGIANRVGIPATSNSTIRRGYEHHHRRTSGEIPRRTFNPRTCRNGWRDQRKTQNTTPQVAASVANTIPIKQQPVKIDEEVPLLLRNKPYLTRNAETGVVHVDLTSLPSKLELTLTDWLDEKGHLASDFVKSFVVDRIHKDLLKQLRSVVLIGRRAIAHVFSDAGRYLGKVILNEKMWFYYRTAGRSHNEYISCGAGVVSRLFLKNRFPTLHEVVSHDWAKGYSALDHVTLYDPMLNRNVRASRGYCWLPLFLNSHIPVSKYPTSPLVRLNYLRHLFGEIPLIKTGTFYHYSQTGLKDKTLPNVLVGATHQPDEIESLPLSLLVEDPLLNTAIDSVVKKMTMRETSHFQNTVDDLVESAIKCDLRARERTRFKIPYHMEPDQVDILKKMLHISSVQVGFEPAGAHPIFNAMRKFFNEMNARAFKGVTVSDIGGSVVNCLSQNLSNVHVCAPIVDVKDAGRISKLSIDVINRAVDHSSGGGKLATFVSNLGSLSVCHKRVPHCSYPSTVITMVDVYDVRIETLLHAMEKKGSVLAKVFLMFPPEFLSGEKIATYPGTTLTVTRDGDSLVYFIGSTGDAYVHSYSTVSSYLTKAVVLSNSGCSYYIEVNTQYGPYLEITISLSKPVSYRKLWRRLVPWNANQTKITFPITDRYGSPTQKSVYVERDFVRRSLAYAANVCNTTDDRTYEYVMSNFRSQTTMMVVGSKIVHSRVDFSNDLLVEVPTAILHEAVNRRNSAVKTMKVSRQHKLVKIAKAVFTFLSEPIRVLLRSLYRSLPEQVIQWFTSINKSEYSIEDTADEIITEADCQIGSLNTECENMEEIFNIAQALAVLSSKSGVMEDEEEIQPDTSESPLEERECAEVNDTSSKGSLNGGATGNWYDFLLPATANAESGDCWRALLWRVIRRLTRVVQSWATPLGAIKSWLLSLFLTILRFLKFRTSQQSAEQKVEKNLCKSLLGFLRSLLINNVVQLSQLARSCGDGINHLGKTCASHSMNVLNKIATSTQSYVNQAAISLGEAAANSATKIGEKFKSNLAERLTNLKIKTAMVLKAAGLPYPQEWIPDKTFKTWLIQEVGKHVPHIAIATLLSGAVYASFTDNVVRRNVNVLFGKVLNFLNKTVYTPIRKYISRIRIESKLSLGLSLLGLLMKDTVLLTSTLSCYNHLTHIAFPVYLGAEISNLTQRCWARKNPITIGLLLRIALSKEGFLAYRSPIKIDEGEVVSPRDPTDIVPDVSFSNRKQVLARALDVFRLNAAKTGPDSHTTPLEATVDAKTPKKVEEILEGKGSLDNVQPHTIGTEQNLTNAPAQTVECPKATTEIHPTKFSSGDLLGKNKIVGSVGVEGFEVDSTDSDEAMLCLDELLEQCNSKDNPTGLKDPLSKSKCAITLHEEGECSNTDKINEWMRDAQTALRFTGGFKPPIVVNLPGHSDKPSIKTSSPSPVVEVRECKSTSEIQSVHSTERYVPPYRRANSDGGVETVKAADIRACQVTSTIPSVVTVPAGKPSKTIRMHTSLIDEASSVLGVAFKSKVDLLNVGFYRNLTRRVSGNSNNAKVFEALAHSLHGLRMEVDAIDKVLKAPKPLIGNRNDLFTRDIQELNMVQKTNSANFKIEDPASNMVGLLGERRLIFNNDKILKEPHDIVFVPPFDISFNLVRTLSILLMLKDLTNEDLDNALETCSFVNAVPGAGKTYSIKQQMLNWKSTAKKGELLLVLTACRNSAQSLKTFVSENALDKVLSVMTIDSYLFQTRRGSPCKYAKILIDECYMVHAGIIIVLLAYAKPESVTLFGDRRQVPFINRMKLLQDDKGMLVPNGNYSEMLTTYRCPADICWWMSTVQFQKRGGKLYSGDVKLISKHPILKSVTRKEFSKTDNTLFNDVDRIMTFTQNEKNELISDFLNGRHGDRQRAMDLIGTVAESQGETYKRVKLVCFKPTDDQVFSSLPHRLVSLTRHTVSLQYICVPSKMNKGIGADVEAIMNLERRVAANFTIQQCV